MPQKIFSLQDQGNQGYLTPQQPSLMNMLKQYYFGQGPGQDRRSAIDQALAQAQGGQQGDRTIFGPQPNRLLNPALR